MPLAPLLLLLLAAACGPSLPDPESRGATVLTTRCGGCHRVFEPRAMTFAMWQVQVDRMRTRFAQRGVPWLTDEEERVLLDYLKANAGTG